MINSSKRCSAFRKVLFWTLCLVFEQAIAQSGHVTGVVMDEFGPVPGAKIVVLNEGISANSDAKGRYRLELLPGKHELKIGYLMYKTEYREIDLADLDTLVEDVVLQSINVIDETSSLGSRSIEKTFLDASLPVHIISRAELDLSGQQELAQVLHYIIPSFHSTHQTIADGTDHVDPVTVRGLGTDQLLVLVNGKRRHASSLLHVNGTVGRGSTGTDLNAIPLAAIERVEFLPYGAASVFGSDAIAGVLNIVLIEDSDILKLASQSGINSRGDGLSSTTGVNIGFDVGEDGFINITAEYRERQSTNRAGEYTGSVFSQDPDLEAEQIAQTGFFDQTGSAGRRIMEIGNSATRNLSFMFNGQFRIAPKAAFYTFGGRNFREGRAHGFYRLPQATDRVVSAIYPLGFLPEIVSGIIDENITFGLRGRTEHWTVDISNTIGNNSFGFSVENSNNASLGLSSPSVFSAGGFSYQQNSTNLDFSRGYDWLQGANLSIGGELRVENYRIIPGEEASWIDGRQFQVVNGDTVFGQTGAQVFPGFQESNQLNRFRTSQAAYLDLESNLTKNFLVITSARVESYNAFDAQLIGKISTRYKLTDGISFRGGVATGYRAPSLQQVFFNNVSTQFINGESVEVGTFNNSSRVSEAIGVERLRPELSLHTNVGVTMKVNDELNFNLSFFGTDVNDRIMLSGILGSQFDSILSEIGVGAAQVLLNAINTQTRGLDFSMFWKIPLNQSSLQNRLDLSANRTKIVGLIDNTQNGGLNAQDLLSREDRARVESAQPLVKGILSSTYKRKKWNITLRNTFIGGVSYLHPEDENPADWVLNTFNGKVESRDQFFRPKVLTDLHLMYNLGSALKLTLQVNNLLNIYPDQHTHSENTSSGHFVYSRRVQQFGVRGTNVFLGINFIL